jgi:hypothetical protein
MNIRILATMVEKFRGRSIVSFIDRWERMMWDRKIEKATEDAHRFVDEYRRGVQNGRDRDRRR